MCRGAISGCGVSVCPINLTLALTHSLVPYTQPLHLLTHPILPRPPRSPHTLKPCTHYPMHSPHALKPCTHSLNPCTHSPPPQAREAVSAHTQAVRFECGSRTYKFLAIWMFNFGSQSDYMHLYCLPLTSPIRHYNAMHNITQHNITSHHIQAKDAVSARTKAVSCEKFATTFICAIFEVQVLTCMTRNFLDNSCTNTKKCYQKHIPIDMISLSSHIFYPFVTSRHIDNANPRLQTRYRLKQKR